MVREYLCLTVQPDTIDGFYKNYTNKVLTYEAVYVDGMQHGPEVKYYNSGKLKYEGEYVDNQKQGLWKWYYESGALMAELNYVDDKIRSHQYYYEDGSKCKKELSESQLPEFPGGLNALMQHMATAQYPYKKRMDDIEGVVLVSFVVDTNGKLEDPTIIYSADSLFSVSALAVVEKMPLWKPGYDHMIKVKAEYLLPFMFRLEGEPNQKNLMESKYYSEQGKIAYNEGNYELAYELFSKAVFLNGDDYYALLNKAITAINLGKTKEACSCIAYLKSSTILEDVKPYLKYCK